MASDQITIYENIIASMEEGVLVFDRRGKAILLNNRARKMLGLDSNRESLSIRDIIGVQDGEYDEFMDAILMAVYEEKLKSNTTISFSLNGEQKRYILTTSQLGEGDGGHQIMAVINDITEIEKLHETFGRYMSDDVADAILNSPGGLGMGGEVREVTILMSDLRGFTAMCESMDAKDVTDMLGEYFGRMYDCISLRNGTIIEFLGDGILAVFGAPVQTKDHASDAVAAAVDMQRAMKEINAYNEERGFPKLDMGIGIHTGDTVVGNIGCEKRTKYGVLGSNVNRTGRIESYTTGSQILISEDTRRHIRHELVIEHETDVLPKGVDTPLHIIQVSGILGPYMSVYEIEHEKLITLEVPYLVTMRKLIGKHVTEDILTAWVTAISNEQARLQTNEDLKIFDNVRIDLAGEIYGKVTRCEDDHITVDFTALPEGFGSWFNTITNQIK